MTVCKDINLIMEKLFPIDNAEEWDNCGLLIGDKNEKINKVMLCLDVTKEVVDEAVEKNCQLIISHHPLIFKPLKRISNDDYIQSLILKLISNKIAVYSAHTNMDISNGGMNDFLASKINLKDIKVLNDEYNIKENSVGLGRHGILDETMRRREFVKYIKKVLNIKHIRYTGEDETVIKKVALCTGAYDGNISNVVKYKADVFIVGEMKYHDVIDAVNEGADIMIIGHYESEIIYKTYLKKMLEENFLDVEIVTSTCEKNILK